MFERRYRWDRTDQIVQQIHTELNGLPERVTDADGQTVWRGQFSTWGETERELSVPQWQVPQNLRFQGQYLDRESGLHYNLFRYYDPVAGRYTQMDPIGLAGGLNTYSYMGDPLVWVDPLGLICKSAYSGRRGTVKAKADLEKNGFKVVAEEVTMRIKNSTTNKTYRIRADIVATDKMGNYHVFEVKNGSGRLTRKQQGTVMFDMTNPANTNSGLGGAIIRPSASKAGKLEVANKGANGLPLGGNGVVWDARFWLLKY